MAKKAQCGAEAERLFVIEQCGLEEIAGRLNISVRTVQNWKVAGEWDTKRSNYLSSRHQFHEELYEFARDLMNVIKQDLAENRDPGNGKLYTLGRLIGSLTKVKDYEAASQKDDGQGAAKGLTPEIIKLIENEIGL